MSEPRIAPDGVGARVRARRLELGLTQTDLAKTLGLSYQQVHKYETARDAVPSHRLRQLSASLSLTVAELLDAADPEPIPAVDARATRSLLADFAALSPADRDLARRLVRRLAGCRGGAAS